MTMKKRIRGRLKKKRGPVVSKKVTHDGIKFASGLEKYMYIALKKAKIKPNTKAKHILYKKVLSLKLLVMSVKAMVKVSLKTEVIKKYYQ